MYRAGKGVEIDLKESFHYILLAADQGHIEAQHSAGVMYLNGRGVTRNAGLALHYLTLSADQGEVGAQINLGKLYWYGREGVKKNPQLAFHYFRLATDQGDWGAAAHFKIIKKEGERLYDLGIYTWTNSKYPVKLADAKHYFEQAAQMGNEKATEYIMTLQPSHIQAFKQLEKEAELGSLFALHALGMAYKEGKLVKEDKEKAVDCFKRAAEAGHFPSHYRVAKAYYKGLGLSQDYNQAFSHFKIAANAGHPKAAYFLSKMYQNGQAVKRCDEMARHYLSSAIAIGYQPENR